MATSGSPSGRGVSSPRAKGRDSKSTFCRNVTIYGHCRFENSGCNFQHDRTKNAQQTGGHHDKRRFNADSPAFTPAPLQQSTNLQAPMNGNSRNATISPKAANAAIFTPKSGNAQPTTNTMQSKPVGTEFYPSQEYSDYDPSAYTTSYVSESNSSIGYDPFANNAAMSALANATGQMQINPYAQGSNQVDGGQYYGSTGNFTQPPPLHLYFPTGPHSGHLLAYQKTAHDFFIPESIRDDLQRRMDAAQQTLQTPRLPVNVEHYHSLVPLDIGTLQSDAVFGYQTWVYKAFSSKDGRAYTLRRLEGYRLPDADAITVTMPPWKRVLNAAVVNIHEAFTTRAFGDSSLIVVTDYHPLSKTLAELHAVPVSRYGRQNTPSVPEATLWGYIVQITSALRAIHSNKLAARVIVPNKILQTSDRRIRLNGCGVMDIVQYNTPQDIRLFQEEDLRQLGRLALSISTGVPINSPNAHSVDHLPRTWTYSNRFKELLRWLIMDPLTLAKDPDYARDYNIDGLTRLIAPEINTVMDGAFHALDQMADQFSRELANGRAARLSMKLNTILERPAADGSMESWSETGTKYVLKLFRDYVFHQVDAHGKPILDLGHMLRCMNKLDAQVDERIQMTSRDNQTVFVASYKELAKAVDAAWNELVAMGANSSSHMGKFRS